MGCKRQRWRVAADAKRYGRKENHEMIRLLFNICLLFTIDILTGCSIHIDQLNPTGTLSGVDPRSEDIYICISKEIPDNFRVTTIRSVPMDVEDYHASIRAGFSNTFGPFFKDVTFINEIPNRGTSILLTRADIKHVMTEFDNEGNPVAATCRVKYNAILYNDGQEVSYSSGEVISEEVSSDLNDFPRIAENALAIMMEEIGTKFFGRRTKM
jgi:hypothetical protein